MEMISVILHLFQNLLLFKEKRHPFQNLLLFKESSTNFFKATPPRKGTPPPAYRPKLPPKPAQYRQKLPPLPPKPAQYRQKLPPLPPKPAQYRKK